jgi:hypothetical protein
MNNLALVLRGQGKYEYSLLSLRIFIMSFDAFVSIPVHDRTSGFRMVVIDRRALLLVATVELRGKHPGLSAFLLR